ncbi:MAG TPA: hypothetical protein VJ840_02600, partial [Gemmatimonadaceae bacterium]|nr:hypothetical protein [Gemmatimonadaceae bacterium]
MHKAKTRLPAFLAIPFALSFVADNAISAQSASTSSVIREQAIGIRTRHSHLSTSLVVENRDEEKGDPGPYVLTGAALGALALGGAAALAADCNDDCMFLG